MYCNFSFGDLLARQASLVVSSRTVRDPASKKMAKMVVDPLVDSS